LLILCCQQLPRLFELMDELLKSPQFDSKAMVSSFVRETVASMEAAFLSSGLFCHLPTSWVIQNGVSRLCAGLNFAMIHMSSSLSMAKWIGEKYNGYSQLQVVSCCVFAGKLFVTVVHIEVQFARALLPRIETDWPAVVADLQELHNIVTTANTTVS
jgi:hypothetical protein